MKNNIENIKLVKAIAKSNITEDEKISISFRHQQTVFTEIEKEELTKSYNKNMKIQKLEDDEVMKYVKENEEHIMDIEASEEFFIGGYTHGSIHEINYKDNIFYVLFDDTKKANLINIYRTYRIALYSYNLLKRKRKTTKQIKSLKTKQIKLRKRMTIEIKKRPRSNTGSGVGFGYIMNNRILNLYKRIQLIKEEIKTLKKIINKKEVV